MVPVSGKFTPEQRKLYDAVVAAHHAAVAAIRPGATFQQVHDAAVEELRKRGLDQYFTFGTSHFIGMDGHDPGNYEEPLAPGMVLTVEPGIIDNQRNVTIHVEDMILVTEQGHENLSAAIPIEAPDVERFLAGTPTS
jgi:Xaa-Pro aminopeptidase